MKTTKQPGNIDGIIRPKPSGRRRRFDSRLLIGIAVIAILAGCAIVFSLTRDDSSNNSDQVNAVVANVNRHYTLPSDEQPALATVTDEAKVSSAFRGKANNGDRILIYQKNALAIVYRPATDRIVAVVPVTIDTPKTGQAVQ